VRLVLDCSAALGWSNPGELTDPLQIVLDEVVEFGAWVPGLWRLEVANGLQMAVRKGRITGADRERVLANLSELNILIDPHTDENAWSATVQLSSRHGLTAYDASYLELAVRRRLPLATLDNDLRAGAKAEGVPLLGV
jgi:predicted nucleic acid-binding protein